MKNCKNVLKISIIQVLFILIVLIATKVQANTVIEVNDNQELKDAIAVATKIVDQSICEISLNKGVYELNNNISIPSNTYIDLNNNTINYSGDSSKYAIYLAPEVTNVKIKNGTIKGGGIYGKNINNVKIENVIFNDCQEHGIYFTNQSEKIELAKLTINNSMQNGMYIVDSGIDVLSNIVINGVSQGFYLKNSKAKDIDNCKISDFKINGIRLANANVEKIYNNTIFTSAEGDTRAIYLSDESSTFDISNNSISLCNHGIFVRKSTVKGAICNNTIDKTIESAIQLFTKGIVTGKINSNTITNAKGLGIILTGPTSIADGSTCTNIESNILKNCKGDGIAIYHGSHCGEIVKNTLEGIGGNHNGRDGDYGIIIDSNMKANTYCARIANNTLKDVTYAGIAIYSGPASSLDNKFQDTAYVEKNIENNTLNNCGMYKNSKDWKQEIATGGKQGCLSSIYVDTHARVKGDISNNTIDKTGEHGIYIHLCSFVRSIYNNTIKNCKEAGIEIYRSTVLNNIENNKVLLSGTNGIAIAEISNVKGIVSKNTIETTGENGIYLKTSNVKSLVNNIMSDVKGVGIYLNEKSTLNDIISNKITMNNANYGFAMKVVANSKIKKIQKNKILGKMTYGIRIMGVNDNVEISSNNLSTTNDVKMDYSAIYLIGNASKKYTITKNTVKGNKTRYGIRILQGKADILNNNVQKTFYPIYIEKNNANVKIKDNKFSGNKKNLIKTPKKNFSVSKINIKSIKAKKGVKVKLTYKASSKLSKYEIYQSTSKNGTYKKIKCLSKDNYKTSKLKANKKYFYKVCGFIKDGKISIYTDDSGIKSIKTKK